MDFEVFVRNEGNVVEVIRYTLPNGTAVAREEISIDFRPMSSYQYFDFVLVSNPNTINQTRHECTFYGLRKGKEGLNAIHYEVIRELPKQKAAAQ